MHSVDQMGHLSPQPSPGVWKNASNIFQLRKLIILPQNCQVGIQFHMYHHDHAASSPPCLVSAAAYFDNLLFASKWI
jgi:hypothetical protein